MNIELLSIQTLVCSIAYFFAGIVDSITGGGGLITLAVMLTVGIPVHNIIATNQCAAFVGTGVGAYKFLRSGKIHRSSALITLPFAVIGSYCGARLNLLVPECFLKVFLLVAVPIIAVFVITNKSLGEVDRIDEQSGLSIALCSAAIGLVLGGYQGFYGAGSGVFFMIAYAALLKLDLVRATGNTRFVLAVASITSVITYTASGAVIWAIALPSAVLYSLGSYLGATLAIKKGAGFIRPVMICVVILLIVKLVYDIV